MGKPDWDSDWDGAKSTHHEDESDDFDQQEWLKRQNSHDKVCRTCNGGKDFKRCHRLAWKPGPDGKPIWATYQCPACQEEFVWERTEQ